MQWLTEIFESTSDQARLATTLIAALIAVTVVFLNQLFNSRRARNEKFIAKVEEMYTTIIKLDELRNLIHSEILINFANIKKSSPGSFDYYNYQSKEGKQFEEMHDEYFRVIASAEMLTGLYFSSLSKDIKALRGIYKRTYISFLESEKLSEYMENANQYYEEIEVVFQRLYSELPKIMNETMH